METTGDAKSGPASAALGSGLRAITRTKTSERTAGMPGVWGATGVRSWFWGGVFGSRAEEGRRVGASNGAMAVAERWDDGSRGRVGGCVSACARGLSSTISAAFASTITDGKRG